MKRARKIAIGVWMSLIGISSAGSVQAATGSGGLFAPSACLSPAVLLIVALTPAETLVTFGVTMLEERLGVQIDE